MVGLNWRFLSKVAFANDVVNIHIKNSLANEYFFITSNLAMNKSFLSFQNVNFKFYIIFTTEPSPSKETFSGDFYKI